MSSPNIFEFGDAELPTFDELTGPVVEVVALREVDAEDFDRGKLSTAKKAELALAAVGL